MKIKQTDFPGLFIIEPKIFSDSRGYFFESYNESVFKEKNIHYHSVQDNQSKSSYGVIRGLHYQLNPYAQSKLIRVLHGEILDVVLDIRKGSPTYGKTYSINLSETNSLQLLIPKGFAHGFSVLSESAIVFYKCDEFYAPQYERGIIYNDHTLQIDWKIDKENEIISEKDKKHPKFDAADNNFEF